MFRICKILNRQFNNRIKSSIGCRFVRYYDFLHVESERYKNPPSFIEHVHPKQEFNSIDGDFKGNTQIGDEFIRNRNGFVKYCTFFKNGECNCPSLLSCIYNYDDHNDYDHDTDSDTDTDIDIDKCFDITHAIPNSEDSNSGNRKRGIDDEGIHMSNYVKAKN